MKQHIVHASVLAGIGAPGLAALAAAPANAMTAGRDLPEGQNLFSVACSEGINERQLFSVDSTDGTSTPIGDGTGQLQSGYDCGYAGAVNPLDGLFYYPSYGPGSELEVTDPETGDTTVVADLTLGGQSYAISSIAIDQDGSAYATGYNGTGPEIYSVDLESGELTYLSTPVGMSWNAFVADPASDDFFTVDYYGEITRLDVQTGEQFYVGDLASGANLGGGVRGLQIDSEGYLWFVNERPLGQNLVMEMWSADPDDLAGTVDYSGVLAAEINDTSVPYFSAGIFITSDAGDTGSGGSDDVDSGDTTGDEATTASDDAAELAETGFDGAPLGFAAAAAMLTGLAVLGARRVRKA